MIDEAVIAELRTILRGSLLLPGHPEFDAISADASQRVREPDLIVRPKAVLDVIHAIRFVRDSKLQIWLCGSDCCIAEVD